MRFLSVVVLLVIPEVIQIKRLCVAVFLALFVLPVSSLAVEVSEDDLIYLSSYTREAAASAEEAAEYAADAADSAEEAAEYAEVAMEAAEMVSQASVMMLSDSGTGTEDENLVAVYSTLDPVTSADATGFKAIILDLIGDYESIVVEYEYENNNGYSSYVREIYPDYTWLCACAIFLVMLYCTFRLGAAILCKQ